MDSISIRKLVRINKATAYFCQRGELNGECKQNHVMAIKQCQGRTNNLQC